MTMKLPNRPNLVEKLQAKELHSFIDMQTVKLFWEIDKIVPMTAPTDKISKLRNISWKITKFQRIFL